MSQQSFLKKHTILIVEDSATQAAQLQFVLESAGYQAIVATHGAEALKILQETIPSLIISDVVMPEMNGYELSKHIKANSQLKDIPMILLTTLSEPADIFMGLECGADHYILKPFDEYSIVSRVGAILADRFLRHSSKSQMGLEITYGDRKYFINADRIQILDLLLATFENIVRKNSELETVNKQLKEALDANKVLQGLIPICAYCKKIRDDKGFWLQVEKYVEKHSSLAFSHGICPDCIKRHFGDYS